MTPCLNTPHIFKYPGLHSASADPPDISPPKNSFGIFLKKYLPDREECAGVKIFLSVIHDYDHPGLNNNFHIKIQSYLATLYNDRAILENHHLAEIFDIVKDPTFDIFGDFSDEQRRDIRETMIEMVTGTDMGLHAKIFGAWKRRIKQDHSMGLLNRHLFSDDSFQTHPRALSCLISGDRFALGFAGYLCPSCSNWLC